MIPRLPRRRTERRGLNLWPVGPVLILAFTIALTVAGGVFYTAWDLLGARGLKPEHRLDSSTLFDLVKLSFGVVAGAGALVALIVAYRRQRVDEDGALRDATRLHTERFTTAVSQLGDDAPAVQLGGVHALAGLANDAPTPALRQTCIDVLCAYLQLPHTPDPGTDPADQEQHHRYLALRTVRHTVLRLIGDHYRLPAGTHGSWQGCNLDLAGTIIDGPLNFDGATFSGGTVSFDGATFSGSRVDFNGATFSGGAVSFGRVAISGGALNFNGATFSGGRVSFAGAAFSGGSANFNGATFSGGDVYFGTAAFSGGSLFFGGVSFSGSRVDFRLATFSGSTFNFYQAAFSGSSVLFEAATFSGGSVFFGGASFSGGIVSVDRVTFSGGTVSFSGATFSGGTVKVDRVTFSGGTVSFADARGEAPLGLVPGAGEPLPPGLILPDAWRS
ncbi:pentapeptide repeat-containing protein [Streptomyces sp. R08]|uniref:Pentapeptide repeat-containing protein n=1 Tax=Streptomyces sp. R08 TaxID=3238624 RepID=A0AB39MQT0_9ACTN